MSKEDRTQPGVYENPDGSMIVKSLSDKDQLLRIADAFESFVGNDDLHRRHDDHLYYKIPPKEIRTLDGYCEQLRIIAGRME